MDDGLLPYKGHVIHTTTSYCTEAETERQTDRQNDRQAN